MLRANVVERHADLLGVALGLVAYGVVQVVHEPALADGVDLVERSRDVEAYGRVVLCGEVERWVLQLLLRKPSLVATSKLQLVAILPYLHGAEDGAERGQLHLPDALQLVVHLLLLGLELLLVGQVLPFASAADAEMLALWRGPYGAGCDEAHHATLAVAVFLLHDLHVGNIAGNAKGNKHHLLAVVEMHFPSAATASMVTLSNMGKGLRFLLIHT